MLARISKMWLSKVNKLGGVCMAANALKRQYGNTLFFFKLHQPTHLLERTTPSGRRSTDSKLFKLTKRNGLTEKPPKFVGAIQGPTGKGRSVKQVLFI